MSSSSLVVNPAADGGWRLPFDVVLGVMAVSRRSTISALMKTCRTLYTEGPKHLLCDGVQLNQWKDAIKFANFMLTEDPSRFAYLRELFLGVEDLGTAPSDQRHFIDFLAHPCLALETLTLRHADVFMGRHAPLPMKEAFCRMKTIKRLVVLNVREESARVIQGLPSPLESISFGVHDYVGDLLDFSSTLKPFSNTLHTLLISSQLFISAFFMSQAGPLCSFPCISTFGIVWDNAFPQLLASPIFAQTFPAISHLKLIPSEHPSVAPSWRPVRRLRGPEGLSRLRIAPPPSLSECSGDLFSVSELGFQYTLSTLRLWQPIHIIDLPALGAVLEDTRPKRLCLTANVEDVAELLATLCTTRTYVPPHIDLAILGPWRGAFDVEVSEKTLEKFCSPLKPLFDQPPPTGLMELGLLFGGLGLPPQPLTREFTRWASTVTPPLTLAWKSSLEPEEEQLHWPDLGQTSDDFYALGDYDGSYYDDVDYDDSIDYDNPDDYVDGVDYDDGGDYNNGGDYDNDGDYKITALCINT